MSDEPYFLDVDDVLVATAAAIDAVPEVRDHGLLGSAVARPQTTVFGRDAYPDLWTKAAALLHSLIRNHPFIDGNKRAAWAAAWVFLEVNGHPLGADLDVDRAEAFMLAAARGELDVPEIATGLPRYAAS